MLRFLQPTKKQQQKNNNTYSLKNPSALITTNKHEARTVEISGRRYYFIGDDNQDIVNSTPKTGPDVPLQQLLRSLLYHLQDLVGHAYLVVN